VYGIQILGIKVYDTGLWFRVRVRVIRVWGLRFTVKGSGFTV
jgi:hypothetical protein